MTYPTLAPPQLKQMGAVGRTTVTCCAELRCDRESGPIEAPKDGAKAKAPAKAKADEKPAEAPKAAEKKAEAPKKEAPKATEDLNSKTVAELRDMAKAKDITGYSSMKKAELIEALSK